MGHPPHPIVAWPEGPSPGFLLEITQDRAIPESPPHTGGPQAQGVALSPEAQPVLGSPGLPREGELGQGGGREKLHKKKLNILKIYI